MVEQICISQVLLHTHAYQIYDNIKVYDRNSPTIMVKVTSVMKVYHKTYVI